MGVSYGLGFVRLGFDEDFPKKTKLQALKALASASGTTVRDVFDDVVVEVSAKGAVKELTGDVASSVRDAVKGASAPSSAFRYLDGYVVCIHGAKDETAVELPEGEETYIGPLAPLVDRLDDLLAQDEMEPACQHVHQALREMCDRAKALKLPLYIGA